jgi:hypothetical protein
VGDDTLCRKRGLLLFGAGNGWVFQGMGQKCAATVSCLSLTESDRRFSRKPNLVIGRVSRRWDLGA